MSLAAHLIFSAYGFWLPNDPRGSWSDFVRSFDLLRFGNATKVEDRHSVACRPHNADQRAAAKMALANQPVIFSGLQALSIAKGFARVIEQTACIIYACAIMPDHVHLVVGRHHYDIQKLANLLKGGATKQLTLDGRHPFSGGPTGRAAPSPWARNCWKVWLDSIEDVERSIEYANDNPEKAGFKRQNWRFVRPYLP
jgi:REP element-mobilizing transposase RayT